MKTRRVDVPTMKEPFLAEIKYVWCKSETIECKTQVIRIWKALNLFDRLLIDLLTKISNLKKNYNLYKICI